MTMLFDEKKGFPSVFGIKRGILTANSLAWHQPSCGNVTGRPEALGGHVEQCNACGATHHVYHSCRNRHCPKCQARAKEQWVTARQLELLPVPYTYLVFTNPHALNGLAASHLPVEN